MLLVEDPFRFDQKGFSRAYELHPKYQDAFEIGFFCDGCRFPENYQFKGQLSLEYFWHNKWQFQEVIGQGKVQEVLGNEAGHLKRVLKRLDMRLDPQSMQDLKVRLTVLKPDAALKDLSRFVKLSIVVRSRK